MIPQSNSTIIPVTWGELHKKHAERSSKTINKTLASDLSWLKRFSANFRGTPVTPMKIIKFCFLFGGTKGSLVKNTDADGNHHDRVSYWETCLNVRNSLGLKGKIHRGHGFAVIFTDSRHSHSNSEIKSISDSPQTHRKYGCAWLVSPSIFPTEIATELGEGHPMPSIFTASDSGWGAIAILLLPKHLGQRPVDLTIVLRVAEAVDCPVYRVPDAFWMWLCCQKKVYLHQKNNMLIGNWSSNLGYNFNYPLIGIDH